MPTFAGRPSTMSYLRWIFRRIPLLDCKGSKCLNCNSSAHHNLFFCWNFRFKNQATTCSDFPSETLLWINEVENSWFIGRNEISAISLLKGFSKTSRCWTRRELLLWRRSSRIHSSRRKSASRNGKPRKRTVFYEETWCDVSMSRCLQIYWPGKCWEITSWWKQGSIA